MDPNRFYPQSPTVANLTVYLDGAQYTGTKFVNCVLVYSGGALPVLQQNEFVNCQWRLDGAANNTLDFMKLLISFGGTGIVLSGLGLGDANGV